MGNYQPGFSEGKSYWKCAAVGRGEGKLVGNEGPREIIQLGFQKAFDKIPHQSLLKQHPQIAGHDQEDTGLNFCPWFCSASLTKVMTGLGGTLRDGN